MLCMPVRSTRLWIFRGSCVCMWIWVTQSVLVIASLRLVCITVACARCEVVLRCVCKLQLFVLPCYSILVWYSKAMVCVLSCTYPTLHDRDAVVWELVRLFVCVFTEAMTCCAYVVGATLLWCAGCWTWASISWADLSLAGSVYWWTSRELDLFGFR
jgi:hypothetical protein